MRKKDNRNTRKPYNHRLSGDYPEMYDEDFDAYNDGYDNRRGAYSEDFDAFDDGYQDDYHGDYDNQGYDNSGYGDDGYRDGDVYGEGNPDDFIHVNLDHAYDPDAEDVYEAPSNRYGQNNGRENYSRQNMADDNVYGRSNDGRRYDNRQNDTNQPYEDRRNRPYGYTQQSYENQNYDNSGYDEGYPGDAGYDEDGDGAARRRKQNARRHGQEDEQSVPVKKIKNRQIMSILYGFLVIFFGMIGYFVYFDVVKSDNVTNNPNNVRIAKLSDTVTRGKIVTSDGTVLAETLKDGNGEEYRYYPYENMFAHVVGVSKLNKSGLEATEEYYLLQSNINPIQKAVNELKGEKSDGDNVITTLNLGLQQVAYNALGSNQGVVIAMEPSTGKILAMVSKPDYNPNTLADNYDAIIADTKSKVLLNQATQGLFTPGSIFKMLTVTEYLREYPNASNYTYTCNGSILLNSDNGTASLSCYGGHVHGSEDLTSSFANSCNSSFANIGLNLNINKFNDLCNSMYFNTSLPTDIPHAQSRFSLSQNASQWEIGATAIGQGETVMTPLHALLLTSSIANGGVVMRPYLVDSVVSSTGHQIEKNSPQSSGSIMSASEAMQVKTMMEAVVNSGTATSLTAFNTQIAGKTGTAEVEGSGNNAWFVGFAPADNPEIAICVLVENSDTSSSYTAVPIASQLFQYYLNQ